MEQPRQKRLLVKLITFSLIKESEMPFKQPKTVPGIECSNDKYLLRDKIRIKLKKAYKRKRSINLGMDVFQTRMRSIKLGMDLFQSNEELKGRYRIT